MFTTDVTDPNTTADDEPMPPEQLALGAGAAAEFRPEPVDEVPANSDAKAPTLVGRDAWMDRVRRGEYMRATGAANDSADGGTPTDAAADGQPTAVGRDQWMADVAAGRFFRDDGGAQ